MKTVWIQALSKQEEKVQMKNKSNLKGRHNRSSSNFFLQFCVSGLLWSIMMSLIGHVFNGKSGTIQQRLVLLRAAV